MALVRKSPHLVKRIHAWCGVVLATMLILISITGTLLIWKNVYVGLNFPQAQQAFERNVSSVLRIAVAAENAFGKDNISHIEFGTKEFGMSTSYLKDKRIVYIAADGEIIGVWNQNERFEDWLLDLHHRLLAGTTGLYIVGITGIFTVFQIITGLIAFWPTRRAFSRGLTLPNFQRIELLRAHRNTGILVSIPIFIIVAAGIVLTFPETSRTIFSWSYQYDESYGENFGDGVDEIRGTNQATWPRAIARAQEVFPNAEISGLVWSAGTGIKEILFRGPNEWSQLGNSAVTIAEADGYMELRIDGQTLPIAERVYNLAKPVHRSLMGGFFYDILQTLIGLSIIYLSLIGLIKFLSTIKRI